MLRKNLTEGISDLGAVVLSPDDALPYVVNISFPSFEAETMLHALEEKGIYVSTVSACSSKQKKISYVLLDMGIDKNLARNAVRFSFSRFNTIEEIEQTVRSIHEVYTQYSVKRG